MRDQVVDNNCQSNQLCKRLLREQDLTLETVLMLARTLEASEIQAK